MRDIIIGTMRWGIRGINFSVPKASFFIENLVEHKFNKFDLADIYGTEELVGNALSLSSIPRVDVELITKCGIIPKNGDSVKYYNTHFSYIIEQAERSLKLLKTDYLDQLLIHRPSPIMHPYEIANAFQTLVKEGKVLKCGVSNFSFNEFQIMNSYYPLVTNQIEFSITQNTPLYNQQLLQAINLKFRPQIWSPLGNYFKSDREQNERLRQIISKIAQKYNTNVSTILLAWIMHHPSKPIPIIGSTQIDRINDLINVEKTTLSDEDWFAILEVGHGESVL